MSPTVTLWQCLSAITLSAAPARLARVDGFDQDKAESKHDERAVILRRLLTSKCDTLEALELADRLFDACPRLVKCFGKKAGMSLVFDRYGLPGIFRVGVRLRGWNRSPYHRARHAD